MNRQIKFRGKMLDSDDWVYGYYILCPKVDLIFKNKIYCDDINKMVDVRYDTIGQFTGLKDKNGTEIYEGDVVKVFILGEYTKGYVKYNEEKGRFDIGWKNEVEKYKKGGFVGSCSCMTNDYDLLEKLGNIYDNKNLLEE